MRIIKSLLFMSIALSSASWAVQVQPTGVMAINPATSATYLAVRVPMSNGQTIEGFLWYNNDGQLAFSDARLAMADSNGAPILEGAMLTSDQFYGEETNWSQRYFVDRVSSAVGDLFIVLHFPPNVEGETAGVGPGVGYRITEDTHIEDAWISSDGNAWNRILMSVDICVDPIYSTNKAGGSIVFTAPQIPDYKTELMTPYPNPFNPSTTVRFSLAEKGRVDLKIYNIRGAQVRALAAEVFDPGLHELTWAGRDDKRRHVASGVYFLQMKFKDTVESQRMVLVR